MRRFRRRCLPCWRRALLEVLSALMEARSPEMLVSPSQGNALVWPSLPWRCSHRLVRAMLNSTVSFSTRISPEDIRWEGEEPGVSRCPGQGGPGPGIKKPMGQSNAIPGAVMRRGSLKNQSNKDLPPSTNGLGKKRSDDIEIFHTETLIKEIEKVFAASHPDPLDIEKAKKSLKEHEQSLIDAIARLADPSDVESEEGDGAQDHREWNQHGANYEDQMVADGY